MFESVVDSELDRVARAFDEGSEEVEKYDDPIDDLVCRLLALWLLFAVKDVRHPSSKLEVLSCEYPVSLGKAGVAHEC